MNDLEKLNLSLHSLVFFRNLLDDSAFIKLCELLLVTGRPSIEQVTRYASFVFELIKHGDNLSDYILRRVLEDENTYVCKRARHQSIDGALEACMINELQILEKAAQITAEEVKASIDYDGCLPGWHNRPIDFVGAYMQRMENIAVWGYGIYAKTHMFRVSDGKITPVLYPDPIALSDLKGYERERQTVVDNTLALLRGKPAANVLLYGDAGTGKSSTVKAVVNAYRAQGLRLIQITPPQLCHIPVLIEELTNNPLKFILFIDDLSFAEHNDDFTALKAILEGSVSAKAPNVVIYATSNRMHLVKELFSDRDGDDIHRNETIQELCSLSERFGLSVSFFRPGKALYLKIVHEIRDQFGIGTNDAALDMEAERFALERGGRSPRVARQFIEYLQAMEG